MSERDPFMEALVYVMGNLRTNAKTQISGLISMWKERFPEFSTIPLDFVPFDMDKELFQKDIDYRISILKKVNEAQKIAFKLISDSMVMIFNEYFGSTQLQSDFPDGKDQLYVCFKISELFLGSLSEAVYINQQHIPIGYMLFAHQYYNLKKGITFNSILSNLAKSKLKIDESDVTQTLEGLKNMGIIGEIDDEDGMKYKLIVEIKLSADGEMVFNQKIKNFIEKAVGLYRAMNDVRTLDTKIPENYPLRSYIAETVKHAATQGYTSAVQVVHFLIQYYEKIQAS